MRIFTGSAEKITSQVLIIPVFEGEKEIPGIRDNKLLEHIVKLLKYSGFRAKIYEHFFAVTDLSSPRYVMLAGMGNKDEFSIHNIRRLAGVCSKVLRQKNIKSFGVFLRKGDQLNSATAWVDGLIAGNYVYNEFKEEKKRAPIDEIHIYNVREGEDESVRRICERTMLISERVNAYRDIINTPANYMKPRVLGDIAKETAKRCGLKCMLRGLKEIKRLKMGGIIAVSSGSNEEPRFIELEFNPGRYKKTLILVGKGVTFDSGGISIKPWEGMDKMKYDMAGAVSVLGAMDVISRLKPFVRVIALIPVVENLPSGSAYRPGDILKMYSGKTVEVISTDAEGRLILADALAYGLKFKPDGMIDIATLTGACVIALGHEVSGILGNDKRLIDKIKSAGEETGEHVWELPLWKEYDELIKSDHADIKNVGGREAGTIQGAIFLKNFVGNTPWAHIDIAGTAWHDNEKPYASAGATGWGIKLLTAVAEKFT